MKKESIKGGLKGPSSFDLVEIEKIKLSDRFLAPPFSILDARQGYWQVRKRQWLSLGIKSELGRKKNLLGHNLKLQEQIGMLGKGSSIFDPVLSEIMVGWFCPSRGHIFDPFAGGSVRGIVASKMGFYYIGIDLSEKQIESNRNQAKEICKGSFPKWIVGDSLDSEILLKGEAFDFFFSCPPYSDLEVYSDDLRDLSTMQYDDFLNVYSKIIQSGFNVLKDDSFACFIVSEIRDKKGYYRGFVPDTIHSFLNAGFLYYNEAIYLSAVGNLPVRTPSVFSASRKLGRGHQNVLIFIKGDSVKAVKKLKEI